MVANERCNECILQQTWCPRGAGGRGAPTGFLQVFSAARAQRIAPAVTLVSTITFVV